MRTVLIVGLPLVAAACSRGDRQAAALDNAANQADPAAAAVMRNHADTLRADGSDANLSAAIGPVQQTMQNAGDTAAGSQPSAPPAVQARPHRAGDTVPPPQKPSG